MDNITEAISHLYHELNQTQEEIHHLEREITDTKHAVDRFFNAQMTIIVFGK